MVSVSFLCCVTLLAAAKSQVQEKAMTLSEAVSKLNATEAELQNQKRRVDYLMRQLDSLRVMNATLINKIAELSELMDYYKKEIDAKTQTDKMNEYRRVMGQLARQVAMQQLLFEERVRSEGDSGIKQLRGLQQGTKSYYSTSVVNSGGAAAAHDHSNYERVVGLGELIVVMNGVEFRTRHNDYSLVQPSASSAEYHSTEDIPFPPVPDEVLKKTTIADQITEMRTWFRAFRNQDITIRDYRPYFQAALCYLEGAWTMSQIDGAVAEPFPSERHYIDATNWFDLQDKIWYTSYNGRKDNAENFAFLPTTILNMTENGPVYSQWNYRILCHKVKDNLPTKAFQIVDDIGTRMANKWTLAELVGRRQARFTLKPSVDWDGVDSLSGATSLLDKIMEEIPGADNYGASINDTSPFGVSMDTGGGVLNAAYYNRYFDSTRGANGLSRQRRGFSDNFLFTALTTQQQIAQRGMKRCGAKGCSSELQRVTYAIPLEVIYLTPLQTWNPYNLTYHINKEVPKQNGRNGQLTASKSFNGTSSDYFYRTPRGFYSAQGGKTRSDADPADTSGGAIGVLSPEGNVRSVMASGIKIISDDIAGVGRIRLRYPIYPVHQEGSHTHMQFEAFKDLVYNSGKLGYPFAVYPNSNGSSSSGSVNMRTDTALVPIPHEHSFLLTPQDVDKLKAGQTVTAVTNEQAKHSHSLEIYMENNLGAPVFVMRSCDGMSRCADGHSMIYRND